MTPDGDRYPCFSSDGAEKMKKEHGGELIPPVTTNIAPEQLTESVNMGSSLVKAIIKPFRRN